MSLQAFFSKLLGGEPVEREDIEAAAIKAQALESDAYVDTQPHLPDPEPAPVVEFPLSARATAQDLRAAGCTNGMSPEQIERCLARVMSA